MALALALRPGALTEEKLDSPLARLGGGVTRPRQYLSHSFQVSKMTTVPDYYFHYCCVCKKHHSELPGGAGSLTSVCEDCQNNACPDCLAIASVVTACGWTVCKECDTGHCACSKPGCPKTTKPMATTK